MNSVIHNLPQGDNPFLRAVKVYQPAKAQFVERAFNELTQWDLNNIPTNDPVATASLKPFKEIFSLIPEMIDQYAKDLTTLTLFGIQGRLRLKHSPDIDTLLEGFEEVGKRILPLGGKAVEFSKSRLPAVLHTDDPNKGGYQHMERKVVKPKTRANSGSYFNLTFMNEEYHQKPQYLAKYLQKATEACNRIQELTGFKKGENIGDYLGSVLDANKAVSIENSEAITSMRHMVEPMFEEGMKTLEKMLDIGLELQKQLPQSLSEIMNSRISELFKYGESAGVPRRNSLKELGTLAYKLCAPVETLKKEAPKTDA